MGLAPRQVTRDVHDYADEMLLGLFLFLGYHFPPSLPIVRTAGTCGSMNGKIKAPCTASSETALASGSSRSTGTKVFMYVAMNRLMVRRLARS